MTKSFILLLTLFIVNISAIAQNNYTGKYYVAELNASCGKMINGGCMIYNYCVLKFDKDSVAVSYLTKAYCTPTELDLRYNSQKQTLTKKYKWMVISDKLIINGFEDFNKYAFKEKNENFVKTLYPQNNKYYVANIMNARTKEPCHESEYCVLKFEKDSVEAMYILHKSCSKTNSTTKEFLNKLTKKYQWNITNGQISIPKFEKYSEYKFEEKDEVFIKSLYPQAITTESSSTIIRSEKLLLNGIVISKKSNESIPFATISFQNNKTVGTYSDVDGKFILNLPNNGSLQLPDTLQITYIGYDTKKIAIQSIAELKKLFNETTIFYIDESEIILKEDYRPPTRPQKVSGISTEKISDKQIRKKKRILFKKK